jgi:polyisoprenoid-binding protein YceI
MKPFKSIMLVFIFAAASVFAQNDVEWKFDKAHSKVGFSVSHMVITDVEGQFREFDGTVKSSGTENFEGADINFTANVNSIDTENEKRDNHLKSDDFFKASEYPELKFDSKSVEKVGDNKYKMVGDLTMRGNTKEVELDVVHNGTVKGMMGNTRAGFKVTGTLNRFDYGLKWNKTLETGGLVVGKEVDLNINVQLIQK